MINSLKSHKPTISFYTLGCRLNQSETAVVQRTFETDGYRTVDFDKPADLVVINTCTVTENGDADTRRLVNKVNRLNPKAQIALIGCQAQVQKEKLTKLPNVRWVVGNERKMDLKTLLEEMEETDKPQVIAPTISRDSFTIPTAGIDKKHTRANIKIQDGCDFFCSFCEIPYARGRARSRQFDDILKEAQILTIAGHNELVLTGINLGTYRSQKKTIVDVINALEQIKGLHRIRISSIEPTTIPFSIIKKMSGNSKLCRYLHIPIQSANNQVLKSMKRKYSYQQFIDFVQKAYQSVPEICLGTDVIVGFPGETEEQFLETAQRLKESPFHYFHVFSYSERYMAKSRNLNKPVPVNVIQKRSEVLRNLSQRKRRLFYESLLGTTQTMLFEQKKGQDWVGLTDNYVRIKVQSPKNLENQIRRVKLQEIKGQCVLGSLTSS